MSERFGVFEWGADIGDQSRLLVHPAGFAVNIPGHPDAHAGDKTPPAFDVRVSLNDKPIEILYRLDRLPTQLAMEPMAVALATAYSQRVAAAPVHVRASRNEELVNGAEAGARAIYARNEADMMEWLSVLVQSIAAREAYALYQVVRFHKSDLNAVQFANLRTALVAASVWVVDEEPLPDLQAWPDSRFALPSVALTLTDEAWEQAQLKANEIVEIDAADVAELTELLIGFATTDHLPATSAPQFMLDMIAERVASNAPTRVSEVLLRNLSTVRNMHDLRGWCWQSLWALGNRAALHNS